MTGTTDEHESQESTSAPAPAAGTASQALLDELTCELDDLAEIHDRNRNATRGEIVYLAAVLRQLARRRDARTRARQYRVLIQLAARALAWANDLALDNAT